MALQKVTGMLKRLSRSFVEAAEDVLPVIFREAAEGGDESGGGAKFHGMAIIGLPGAKFHAMTGQSEGSHEVRRARIEGKAFSQTSLGRPDYYGAFEQYNSLTIN